jgi:bacterioferritin-associated ferredoxin
MIVCLCRGLAERTIQTAIARGGDTLERLAAACGAGADILEAEEKHVNWIEAQMTLIAQAGEGNYLAQQIKDEDE